MKELYGSTECGDVFVVKFQRNSRTAKLKKILDEIRLYTDYDFVLKVNGEVRPEIESDRIAEMKRRADNARIRDEIAEDLKRDRD
jgi:hypothetical protein